MSGSGEGNYALGPNGSVIYCTSNKAQFVFDSGFGVDIAYLWALAEQCGIFGDVLVDIRDLGGSSDKGVNDASTGRRTGGNKKRSAERGLSSKNAFKANEANERHNETNNLLRSIMNRGRGCDELVSQKSTEICLIRSTVTDLTMQILSALKLVLSFQPGEEFYQAARDGLNLLKEQQGEAKASLVTAVSELEELKERDAAMKSKKMKRARSEGGGNDVIFIPDGDTEDVDIGIDNIDENKESDEHSADLNHVPNPDAGENDDLDLDESSDDDDGGDDLMTTKTNRGVRRP